MNVVDSPVVAPSGSLGKGLLVLESLLNNHRVTDIANSTGLSVSSVHRILSDLRDLGWVYQDGSKSYFAGARLLGLAGVIAEDSDQSRIIKSALGSLVEATGYTMHYGSLQGIELVYAAKLEGTRSYRMRSRVGLAVPLHSTAIGKAILAAIPTAHVRQIIARTGLSKMTAKTITDEDVLLRELARTRDRGWAVDDGENEEGTRCIGVVVLNRRGIPVGGVSLSALAYDLGMDRVRQLAPQVVAAAERLSASLLPL